MKNVTASPYQSILRHLIVGVAIVGFAVFGIGGWAATMELVGRSRRPWFTCRRIRVSKKCSILPAE